jgi:hypothetical protein
MGTAEIPPRLASLGEDLVLLLQRPDGEIGTLAQVAYGLMGASLIGLAAAGRAEIEDGRIVVRSAEPTGDRELDAALTGLARARRPPRLDKWVGRPRHGLLDAYLRRMTAAGTLTAEPDGRRGPVWYRVADARRTRDVRRRLNVLARSTGRSSLPNRSLGGLVRAIELDSSLYPGPQGQPFRERLDDIALAAGEAANLTAADAVLAATVTAAVLAVRTAVMNAAIGTSVVYTGQVVNLVPRGFQRRD